MGEVVPDVLGSNSDMLSLCVSIVHTHCSPHQAILHDEEVKKRRLLKFWRAQTRERVGHLAQEVSPASVPSNINQQSGDLKVVCDYDYRQLQSLVIITGRWVWLFKNGTFVLRNGLLWKGSYTKLPVTVTTDWWVWFGQPGRE